MSFNEKVVRLIAAQVTLLTLITLLTGWTWLALFLAADFSLRAFTRVTSPLGITQFLFLHYPVAAYVTGGVLVACTILKAVFNICLGCYVHNWIIAPIATEYDKIKKNSNRSFHLVLAVIGGLVQ